MSFGYRTNLKNLLHPFLFVLKEGEMQDNLLDYKLMMLQTTCPEIIKSPPSLQLKELEGIDPEILRERLAEIFQKQQM
jgi:hypothetical protein